jgi:hypothetical protein
MFCAKVEAGWCEGVRHRNQMIRVDLYCKGEWS